MITQECRHKTSWIWQLQSEVIENKYQIKSTESPATSLLALTNTLHPVVRRCRLGCPAKGGQSKKNVSLLRKSLFISTRFSHYTEKGDVISHSRGVQKKFQLQRHSLNYKHKVMQNKIKSAMQCRHST